jgi:DNA-binding NarL/FixJ family response regulator
MSQKKLLEWLVRREELRQRYEASEAGITLDEFAFLMEGQPPKVKVRVREGDKLLSPRQKQVFELLAEGKSNREIADVLAISVKTVDNHVECILGKLYVHSRVEAVIKGFKEGLLLPTR